MLVSRLAQAGQTEVRDHGSVVSIQKDIVRLQVSVENAQLGEASVAKPNSAENGINMSSRAVFSPPSYRPQQGHHTIIGVTARCAIDFLNVFVFNFLSHRGVR